MTMRRFGWLVAIPLIGLILGVGVAVASSLSSLSPDRHGETNGFVASTPSPMPSPSPTVATPGILGGSVRLLSNGSNTVIAVGSDFAIGSADGGHTWIVVRPPAKGSGLAVDPANPRHAITGGTAIQVTSDGGVTWNAPVTTPPGSGPYQPLAVSPVESNVWFFVHKNRLLVTRDGSSTWAEVSVPQLTGPILVPGKSLGQFFLATGNRIFQLSNYAQKINEEPAVPQGDVTDLVAVGGNGPSLLVRVAGKGVFVLSGSSWVTTAGSLSGPVAAGAGGVMLVGNGGGKVASPGFVSYSLNGGTTWVPSTGLPFDQTVEAIGGQLDSRTFFAYCYGGDIYTSSDAGHSWSLLTNRLRSG